MIMNPITNEIVSEDNFQMFNNWQSIEFIAITNCEEVTTDTGFTLTGSMNGQSIQCELTQEEYFEGKNFTYNEAVTAVSQPDEIITTINSIPQVSIATTKFKNLYRLTVNNITIADFKLYPNDSKSILLLPHVKHFFNSKTMHLTLSELINLINERIHESTITNPWIWTQLTESLKPERKAGDTVPTGYLTKGHNEYYPYSSWIQKGYVTKVYL